MITDVKEGWEVKKLEDIIESNIIGLTKNSSEQDIHYKYKYVKMNNITKDNCFSLSKFTCVNAEKDELKKYSLAEGDFLFNTRNSYELVGKTCLFEGYSEEVVLYNNNIMRIRFLKSINPFFINYAFCTKELIKKLDQLKSGTTNVSAIYYKDLRNLELLIPPLPEQQRIVSILDEAFAAIARAKASAEQNLKNAKELFESYLQGVFENKDSVWQERKLGDLCREVTVGFVGTMANKYKETGIPFLRSQNIKPYYISLKDVVYIDDEFNKVLKKSQLNPGDLAIVRTGYPGTAAVIPDTLTVSNCSDLVIVKTGIDLDPYFLSYFFNSTYGKKLVLGNLVGAAQKHFNVTAAKKVFIPLPSLKEQHKVIRKLDLLLAETKKLESIYRKKIADLEELKKSLLEKAFKGELTGKLVEV